MKLGYVVASLAVVGYLALELTALQRAQHRMEPDYVYQRLVAAEVGVQLCGDPPPEQVAGFEARMAEVKERVRSKLAEARARSEPAAVAAGDMRAVDPSVDTIDVEAAIAELRRQAEMETADTLAVGGCDSFMARRLLRRHEIEARR